jgi:hypothetical protein
VEARFKVQQLASIAKIMFLCFQKTSSQGKVQSLHMTLKTEASIKCAWQMQYYWLVACN